MKYFFHYQLMFLYILLSSCAGKEKDGNNVVPIDTTNHGGTTFDINSITDTYPQYASLSTIYSWGCYNVHDPSILKTGTYYYAFSTDAGFGVDIPSGIQIRKSKDLVEWTYVGTVFKGTLPSKAAAYIRSNGIEPFNSLWAPYIMKVGDEYRLYFSLSSSQLRTSTIGLATASNPEGPWTEKGIVISSNNNWNIVQTNAIDPTVLVDKSGKYWLYYGSAFDGIYVLELDPETGLRKNSNDRGSRIANRGYTNTTVNGNIEGPEIIYNAQFDKYYLFMAYDWLETKYNVRVCRADNPEGPFYDYDGLDANTNVDHGPMIIAPYRFIGHAGWQGVSHCSVFTNGNQYFIAHQGRPAVNKYYMVLHVRELFWTTDGWPVASPERYAGIAQKKISKEEITGNWERIRFKYTVVPGYSAEQTSPNLEDGSAEEIQLTEDGYINGDQSSTWTYKDSILQLSWNDGSVDKVLVKLGRDWENKTDTCLIFTGMNNVGTPVWGKKKS